MHKFLASSLIIGKPIINVPKCHSTNDFVTELALKRELMEGGVVVTPCQIKGRGQRGNSWESNPGENLTFSVLLQPHFLDINKQIYLNYITALAVTDYLDKVLSDEASLVKWPNDVFVKGRKISGILIENTLKKNKMDRSVLGIGLNIHQKEFITSKAISLSMLTGKEYDLENSLEQLLMGLERRYLQLRNGNEERIKEEYIKKMYWKDEEHLFKMDDHYKNKGIIRGVDDRGWLEVEIEGKLRQFNFKEIEYLS